MFFSGRLGSSTERAVVGPALFTAPMSDSEGFPEPPSKPQGSERPAGAKSVAVTIDAGTGHVDRIEIIEGNGARRELSGQERADLVEEATGPTLETIFERSFLAGIDSVLGDGAREEEEPESEGERALVRGLLQPMIERSAAQGLLRREVLRKAVLRALVQDASTPPPSAGGPAPEGKPAGP